jgi:hypothetical protein
MVNAEGLALAMKFISGISLFMEVSHNLEVLYSIRQIQPMVRFFMRGFHCLGERRQLVT